MKIVLFENKYKHESKHPDFKLSIKDGEDWASVGAAWLGNTKKGDKMLTLNFDSDNLKKYLKQQKDYTSKKEEKTPPQEVDPADLIF